MINRSVCVWWGDKSLLSKWEFRINSPCSPNLRPEHSLCKSKLRRLFQGDRVYQSNTLFGCTSVYESSPLSLKMKKYGPHLVWIVHVFVIFTEVSLSFHLQGKKKGGKKSISGHSKGQWEMKALWYQSGLGGFKEQSKTLWTINRAILTKPVASSKSTQAIWCNPLVATGHWL